MLHCAKGISQNQFKEDFEKVVKAILPKHHISVIHEKQQVKPDPGITRKLHIPTQVKRK